MIDAKLIRENNKFVKDNLAKRNKQENIDLIDKWLFLDQEWRELLQKGENLKSIRNQKSKQKPNSESIKQMQDLSLEIKNLDETIKNKDLELKNILLSIPNLPLADVPYGKDETSNEIIRVWGEKPKFNFEPKTHEKIAVDLDILDFERAAKISGARFVAYKGLGAKLERALINFMLDLQTKNGYTEIIPPLLVNSDTMTGTGQLPKFSQDSFKCSNGDYWLIPTAEVPLTNLRKNEILKLQDLPQKYVAYTPCFRSEAGSYGKDTKGIIRQHQFNKVELVKITLPEDSDNQLELLTKDAENVLQELNLHYRVVKLCSADLGFSAAKTYDLEVWFPAQNCYREISSCSNCLDFQARRANIKFKRSEKTKPEFVHTLNGSGLAVGRTFAAILENYQTDSGDFMIPSNLKKYI